MLSQYTWGQFFLFVLALIGVYYLVIGLLYYRDELAAVLKGRKLAHGPALPAAGTPPALVRTTSVFAAAPTGEVAAPPAEAAAGAADNLPEPAAPLVGGTLPDSAAAKGSDAGEAEATAPMDADVASAVEQEQQLDESRPDEKLDEADKALAEMIRQAGAATASADPAPAVLADELTAEAATQSAPQPDSSENPGEAGGTAAATDDFALEAGMVYQPAVADDTDPFAAFAEPLASPLAILPVEQEPLVEADSLASFLAQVQLGNRPVVPAGLRGTSLVEQMADLTLQNNQELLELFGQEA